MAEGRTHARAGRRSAEVVDPTGCGDAFRAALLYGLERGWSLERCVALGNRIGALKIASRGGQNQCWIARFFGLSPRCSSWRELVRSRRPWTFSKPSRIVVALVAASAATWAACRWFYGKKLVAAALRLKKSDQSRLFSQQQTAQAKKQIEALKKELEEQRKQSWSRPRPAASARRELELALLAAEKVAEDNSGMMPLAPTDTASPTRRSWAEGSPLAPLPRSQIKNPAGAGFRARRKRLSLRACCPSETAKQPGGSAPSSPAPRAAAGAAAGAAAAFFAGAFLPAPSSQAAFFAGPSSRRLLGSAFLAGPSWPPPSSLAPSSAGAFFAAAFFAGAFFAGGLLGRAFLAGGLLRRRLLGRRPSSPGAFFAAAFFAGRFLSGFLRSCHYVSP